MTSAMHVPDHLYKAVVDTTERTKEDTECSLAGESDLCSEGATSILCAMKENPVSSSALPSATETCFVPTYGTNALPTGTDFCGVICHAVCPKSNAAVENVWKNPA